MSEPQHPEAVATAPRPDEPIDARHTEGTTGDYSASAPNSAGIPAFLRSLDYRSLIPGALAGLVCYVALVVFAFATLLLALAGVSASNGGKTEIPTSSMIPGGAVPSPWSIAVQLAVQLTVMSQFGVLGASIDATVPFLGNVHGSAGVFAVPLLLTAFSIVALFFAGRFVEKRTGVREKGRLWLESVATGLAFSLLVNVMGAVFSIAFPATPVKVSPLCAVTFGSVVVAFLIGTFATMAGRASLRPRSATQSGLGETIRTATEAVAVHYAIFLGIAVPITIVALGIKFGWQATLTAPFWGPTAGFYLFGLGHLGAVSRNWNVSSSVSSSGNSAGSDFGFGLGSGLTQAGAPNWGGAVLLLLAVIAIVATSVFWYLRRGPLAAAKTRDWVVLPAAFLIAGLVTTWVTTVSGDFDAGSLATGGGSFSLAAWTGFVMMLWGGVTEASARYVAPQVVGILPMSLVRNILREPRPTLPAHTELQDSSGPTAAEVHAGPAPVPAVHPALAPRPPMSASRKRTLVLVFGGVALVAILAVAATVATNMIKAANGPDKPVAAYLQALQNGDASKALALSDPGLANDQRSLLTNEVYGKANKRVDGFEIVSSTISDSGAVVVAELRQDGRKQRSTFNLRKADPEMLDDHWKIESAPLGGLTISTNGSVNKVLVNGQEVDLGSGSNGRRLPALPGEYVVELPPAQKYLAAPKSTALVEVDPQSSPTAVLQVEAAEALKTEVMAQVDAHLAECLKSTDPDPAGCPFSSYSSTTYARNFHWTMQSKPTFSLTPDSYGSSAPAWRLTTDSPGEATVSYEKDNSYGFGTPEWKPEKESRSVSLSATVTVTDGTVNVEYSSY